MEQQHVILVNLHDEPTGIMEKMEAHRQGVLHRAFSVFVFDKSGNMLLQKRAEEKYHGAGLWSNTCCSHPYPGEDVFGAATRRLREEMGFETALKKIFAFTYQAKVENDLIEHEYDHVFVGEYEGAIDVNKSEVAEYAYCEMNKIREDLKQHPEQFTTWFALAFPKIENWWQAQYGRMKVK